MPAARAAAGPAAGFYAPPAAGNHIAVGDDATPLGRAAAAAAITALGGGGWRAFASGADPNAADCSSKPYAAYRLRHDRELSR